MGAGRNDGSILVRQRGARFSSIGAPQAAALSQIQFDSGFETDLRTIVDLDMNRVASITILKDAASTALYGANAANGVIVVETIKPKPGKLRVNYTADFRVETPDLSDYNMMNAEEKLEFDEKRE